MKTIPAYSFHPETGIYVGETVADESPLEPGVYLFPAHSTNVSPPSFDAQTERAVWNGAAWAVEAIPEPEPEPEPPVDPGPPAVVTRRQGRLALLYAGKLDDVEAAIEAIADPVEKRAAQIEYEADTWERGNAFLQAMWAQLGGTEEQLDQLFITAAGL